MFSSNTPYIFGLDKTFKIADTIIIAKRIGQRRDATRAFGNECCKGSAFCRFVQSVDLSLLSFAIFRKRKIQRESEAIMFDFDDSSDLSSYQSSLDSSESQSVTLVHTKSSSEHLPNVHGFRKRQLQKLEGEMLAVRDLYLNILTERQWSRLERLDCCRTAGYFMVETETGQVRVGSRSCHVRFCPLCGKSRENVIRRKCREWLKNCKEPKFLTFTLKHNDDNLFEQIQRLYDCFKRVRRHKLLKKAIRGGVWFFQIKLSANDGLWHPHIHFIVDSAFIPQRELSESWQQVTTDSYVVDIRQVKNISQVADYVARYATCPCKLEGLTLLQKKELFYSLEARRLNGTVGSAFKQKIMSKPKFDPSKWKKLMSYMVVERLRECDDSASIIWHCWKNQEPLPHGIDLSHLSELCLFREYQPPPPKKVTKQYSLFDFGGCNCD